MSASHSKDNDGEPKVKCLECESAGNLFYYHRLDAHLKAKHGINRAEYVIKHPGAPTISAKAARRVVAKPATGVAGTVAWDVSLESTEDGSSKFWRVRQEGETLHTNFGRIGTQGQTRKKQYEDAVAAVEEMARARKEKLSKGYVSTETAAPTSAKPSDPSTPASAKPFVFRSGVELHRRDSLNMYDKAFVPVHDPHWQVGAREMDKMEAIAVALDEHENVFDVGPTGCGKTAGVYQLAAALNQPVRKIPLSGDTRVGDFFGQMVVEVDEKTGQAVTRWRDGVFTEAMRLGHWILLDEIDGCPPAILFSLHSVLEKGGHLTLAGNGGEVVQPHPEFRVFATANTLGRGDDTGMYTGTNILNEAFLDRFGVVVQSDYPEAETETAILVKKTGVAKGRAEKMVEVARRVRESAAADQLYCTFSTRRLLAWASKAVKLKNVQLAAEVTVLNKLNPVDRAVVAGLIQRHIGSAR